MLKIQALPCFAKRMVALSLMPASIRKLSSIRQAEVEPMYEESDLHKIKTSFTNPMDIFSEWYNEHCAANINVTSAKAFSLATISKAGKVSCRSLILRRLDKDGFVMMTDGRSRKSTDMADNPQASMLFLWLHKVPGEGNQTRQVRIEGVVNKLNTDNMQELYDIEPLFCKIRAQICEQGQEVDWERLKRDHDRLLGQVTKHNIQLPKPDHIVAYKLVPNVVEFYESIGQRIADRLLFVKDDSVWQSSRLAA
ncbi:pyridoxine/pyridoxamine 5'-phosphate oxidase-like [Adelges cooleyi]|uniref:pyridoxine/pyridoxamine 5'-phosphate oxidase-like n=1 Tax=Adelges cooleyi TaxID=133065 RepID=UPI00217FA09E|nr:pyridoxine/pyridoxamine 5'-phosphate oxidase-like [Adelges cooleyi]